MERPEDSSFYAEDQTGRYCFVAWGPPPRPGDELCRSITGRTEAQLVRDILDGKYNHFFEEAVS